ncbi:hypothetical protein KY290_012873 [Solanum tuberosum]|uniref:Uncharacterized protein n=1 Tax=Solanum tuberosum TaxID=4113 RepID=A0ABQ7VK30_SOLTU|nr:hypothetical protein KY284_021993 [Solanum tuberosum]KAH0695665.1 hypothetical protein KY289_013147 [Solanum tuberosum]KAH0768892.1 hypothetical protein KY290_012873 [Solanum tuberosum]
MDIRMLSTRPRPMLRMPRPMRAVHGRRRLTVVCRPRAMRPGHVRRRLTVVCSPRAIRAGHGRSGQSTADVG